MVVTCPACTARYKLDDSKIKGRGARITCPKCSHKFVVYKDQPAPEKKPAPVAKATSEVPPDLATRDFNLVGITFTIRKSIGLTYEVISMVQLERFRSDGRIEGGDEISWDRQSWTRLDGIDDEESWFWDVWQRAERGEIRSKMQVGLDEAEEDDEDDEDDEDAPTSIIGTGSNLAEEIRKAVQEQETQAPHTPSPVSREVREERAQGETTACRGNQDAVVEASQEAPAPAPKPVSTPAPPPKPPAAADGGGGMSSTMMVGIAVLALIILVGLLFASGTLGG